MTMMVREAGHMTTVRAQASLADSELTKAHDYLL
jgi:hypothetical protein